MCPAVLNGVNFLEKTARERPAPRGLAFAEGEIFRAQGCSGQAGWLAPTRLYW